MRTYILNLFKLIVSVIINFYRNFLLLPLSLFSLFKKKKKNERVETEKSTVANCLIVIIAFATMFPCYQTYLCKNRSIKKNKIRDRFYRD